MTSVHDDTRLVHYLYVVWSMMTAKSNVQRKSESTASQHRLSQIHQALLMTVTGEKNLTGVTPLVSVCVGTLPYAYFSICSYIKIKILKITQIGTHNQQTTLNDFRTCTAENNYMVIDGKH